MRHNTPAAPSRQRPYTEAVTPSPPPQSPPPQSSAHPYRDIAASFGPLGLSAFGGPTAHLGYFRREFVQRRQWLSDGAYATVVSLSQFLPGPASSQVGMALGYHRGKMPGLALAWLLFTAPSAILLAGFGLYVGSAAVAPETSGWIAGLLAAAVAIVAHAVFSMGRSLLKTPLHWVIAVLTVAVMVAVPAAPAWLQVALIAIAGGIGAGMALAGRAPSATAPTDDAPISAPSRAMARASAVLFVVLLIGLSAAAHWGIGGPWVARAHAYYQAGALVFGGGHVVLPLLENLVVVPGWVSQEEFIAGYSAAQAVPGPLFTFASYLGAVDGGIPGAIVATVMIFLPATLLIIAGLYYWVQWSRNRIMAAAFSTMNAAVVGLLAAALWHPIITHGLISQAQRPDVATIAPVLIVAACAVAVWRGAPAWAIAAGSALAGALFL